MAESKRPTSERPRLRLDLASRLFGPHWSLFRIAGPRRAPSGAIPGAGKEPVLLDPEARPLDIICAGMYRACSTWQYEVVAHLLEAHHNGARLGYLSGEQYAALARLEPAAGHAPAGRRWRVLKSHDADRSFARALAEGRARAVYAYRDVRDVVFSLMHKRGLSFAQLLRQGMIHQILANDGFWTSQPGVLVQRYEDLLVDPAGGVLALARHLGIELAEGEAGRIAHEYSRESNRARTEALRRRLHEAGVDLESGANVQICDSTTLLHWNHMRTGETSWRKQVGPHERALLHRLCGAWLLARGYDPVWGPGESDSVRVASLQTLVRNQVDLMAGRANFLAHAASLRFPRTLRLLKRTLGMAEQAHQGATVWPEAIWPRPAAEGRAGDDESAAKKRPADRAPRSSVASPHG